MSMQPSQVLDSNRERIFSDLRQGVSRAAIARQVGVPVTTLKDWLGRQEAVPMAPIKETPDEVLKLKEELRLAKQAANKTKKQWLRDERLLDAIQRATQLTPSLGLAPPLSSVDPSDRSTAVLKYSDAHYGEVVEFEAVNGLNAYDPDIAKARILAIPAKVTSHVRHYVGVVDTLEVWAEGDNLSGDNHEELKVSNAFPIAQQAWHHGLVFGQMVAELRGYFPNVVVRCVPGNHPRVGKPPANKMIANNFDWLSCKFAEQATSHLEGVEWHVPESGMHPFKLGDRNVLCFHGDGIRSSMPGVPWGGVMRRRNQLQATFAEHFREIIDYYSCGHLHQLNWVDQGIFMNGSVKGTDEYSLKNFGGGQKAKQMLFLFNHARNDVTGVHPIDLQEVA